jgi:glycine cleavage system H protein
VHAQESGASGSEGAERATIGASKWVGPGPAPVTGEIVEVNEVVKWDPGLLNGDPYGEGWLVRLKPSSRDASGRAW